MNNRRNHIRTVLWAALMVVLPSNIICIHYSPIDFGELSDCAMILKHPGEHFDRSLKSDSDFPINCITNDAIKRAYLNAIPNIEQLQEIKKVEESQIICKNANLGKTVLIYAMVLPDLNINPCVPSESSIVPSMDLSHLREVPVVDESAQNRATYVKVEVPVLNQTFGQPSGYEYHVKTVAITEGGNPLITLKDILNPSLSNNLLPAEINVEDDHLRPRRSVNNSFVDKTTTMKSEPALNGIISSSSNKLDNITLSLNSSSSSSAAKDLTKRSSYPSHRPSPPSEMTQAIMEEDPGSSEDHPYHNRRSSNHLSNSDIEDDEAPHNIDEFFRKNVPIYDGIPLARQEYHPSSVEVLPEKFNQFSPSTQDEEEEEEDGKPMKGLLEVYPNADMEYEYVPMKINEFGKQIVMEGEADAENEVDDQPSYPYHPSSNYHSDDSDHDSDFYDKPAPPPGPSSHAPSFDNFHSSPFKSLPKPAPPPEPFSHSPSFDNFHSSPFKSSPKPAPPPRPSSHSPSFDNFHSSPFKSSKPAPPPGPSSHSPSFDNFPLSPFKSSPNHYHHGDFPPPSFSDDSPTNYGTSHQYNSFADQQPRYYKHFKPSIPHPAHDEGDHFSPSHSPYSAPSRLAEYSGHGSYYDDFAPKGAPSTGIQGSFASSYPTRSTHVPQTLEEYHRIHGTFDTSQKSNSRPYHRPIIVAQDNKNKEEDEEKSDFRPYHRPIIVAQDNKNKEEDEEEEKDKDTADYSRVPKSFVSMNIGTTGTSGASEDGISIRHEIGHRIPPRKPYFRPAATTPIDIPDHQDFSVEYPSETDSGLSKFKDDSSPESIKNFVDSFFKQPHGSDIVVGKKSNLVSPYNPHFGERVRQKNPEQNILWHTKGSSDGRVTRDKHSRDKNDRLLHEENIKLYDSLVKEVTLKPAKRNTNNDRSRETKFDEMPSHEPQETQPNQDEVDPEDEEEEPQFTYWSQSSSEPN